MHDAVGEVLAQRKALDRGAGAGIALSLVLHGAITAAAVFAALRHPAEQSVEVIQIKLARPAAVTPAPAAPEDRLKPVPTESVPAPVPQPKPQHVVKPVAASPFGKSTKKATEPPAAKPTTDNRQPPATGNPQLATPNDIPVGGTGAVVEGDFPYSIYIERMKTLVGQHWFRPQAAPGVATTVKFVIDRDGTIRDSALETGSGNGTFDRAALRAIIESSPLPPLPFGYSGTYLSVHLTFK
jgi:TonB family protein